VRSVNQYRRRDTLAYLGLRYYLGNEAARSDRWAREVATNLALTRTELPYFRTLHFKERDDQGIVQHRDIFLPSPNEALAEAALLEECGDAFSNPPTVFSYALNAKDSRSGSFRAYMPGLRDRHDRIAEACDHCPSGIVQYADIKRFYPSIGTELAAKAWHQQCEAGRLSKRFRDLGAKLIADHATAAGEESRGILTGPMFSHLLGNLVLRGIDGDLSESLPVKYFRYVDDIVLVGEQNTVNRSLAILRDRLDELGFKLHDDLSPKSIAVSTGNWLKGRGDFSQSRSTILWLDLIRGLKQFLLQNPDQQEVLQSAFRSESFRIPVRDYSLLIHERDFLERLILYAKWPWSSWRREAPTVQALIQLARQLRGKCELEFHDLLEGASELSEYERKRRIPKLRYRAGMLIYLAEDGSLLPLASAAGEFPELHLHCQVMKAVGTGEIDELLPLGNNAAQAAAQPLFAAGKRCSIAKDVDTEVMKQGLAIFLFNGVPVTQPESSSHVHSEMLRFAASGSDAALMRSADPYIREVACLHGLTPTPRHPETLATVFDEDEDLAMDAVEQLQQSASP